MCRQEWDLRGFTDSLETVQLPGSSGQLLSTGLAVGWGCGTGGAAGAVGVWGLIALLFLTYSPMIFRGVWRFFFFVLNRKFLFHFMLKLQAPLTSES